MRAGLEARSARNWVADAPNLASLLFAAARAWAGRPAFRVYRKGAWHALGWPAAARQAASLARGLRALGVGAGDRVVIVSENRPEVLICEWALMAIRAVPVPTYITNTAADHAHVLADCGATAAIVSTSALAATLRAAGPLDLVVCMQPAEDCARFDTLAGDGGEPGEIEAEAATIPRGALACLIYTSGTGNEPKGVMTPHRAILSNICGGAALLAPLRLREEVYLSFLPASHSYEHMAGMFLLPALGVEVVFGRGIEHLAADLLTVRPTLLTVVPRLLEVMRGRINVQLARGPAWRRALFDRAQAIGLKRLAGTPLSVAERLADPLLDRLVRAKVRARFGGRLRAAMSGGARLEPELGRFFLALGLLVLQGYGQTEAGPAIAANSPLDPCPDTVGRPLPGVELRIAEDGEVLVRGDCVMDGYWGRPGETAAALADGWLHTGDLGAIEANGHLRITDRKKDIIKLSGGDTISPARIENLLMAETEIAQAVVGGDGEPAVWALLVPADRADEPAVRRAVARVNDRLPAPERLRRHRLVAPFTQENGLLTASQKIRRRAVLDRYIDEISERKMNSHGY